MIIGGKADMNWVRIRIRRGHMNATIDLLLPLTADLPRQIILPLGHYWDLKDIRKPAFSLDSL
ncbi:hypothetical protein BDV23DRAFT_167820 [Aspergillus alliaceus]|uniref:Uncharacterized protein n=1 Tax=Petromyces alliaceus TaxID=209559 RepID=A0A5N7BQ88_PETAA|nr:hypothetical protein BDV23DRAFT_167820 [Aspergillus alliaceus]